MEKERLKKLLLSLHQELETTDSVDSETRQLASQLDSDIKNLLNPAESVKQQDSVLEQAELLETTFAAKHPTAETFIREIIDILGRMGI
ncbi:MAG: DUF4404 family protein [Gammaproteobacteria bacterium]|nr:DUF4404 family protein [Gammaproteobacteria bacterium]